jgi:dihydrofolate reductase
MRDLVVTENITLDGVIDASEGWFSPAEDDDVDQSDVIAALREQSEAADAVLFGRVTFEEMRGYWPKQTDDTTGSITLVHALIAAGLVDEYRLFPYPVVLGRGTRLFAEGTRIPSLRLVETRPFRSGLVLLRYRPA